MIAHALILASMLVTATGLLLYSLGLPAEDMSNPTVIVRSTPEPVFTASASPENVGESPDATVAEASAAPTPAPTPSPTPTPTPTVDPLTSYSIAATTPQSVLRQAQVHAGRVDPFKSVQPPDLPAFEPAISANQLTLPAAFPALKPDKTDKPTASRTPIPNIIETQPTPVPVRPLTQGLSLKGIMDGGIDPIAIIEINGRTELFRVGERLPNNIRVTSINYEERRVTVSRGQATGTLYLPEPNSPNF